MFELFPYCHIVPEIEEDGARRALHDEDASSCREGLWKRINTLKHYRVQDGSIVHLLLNSEMTATSSLLPSGDYSFLRFCLFNTLLGYKGVAMQMGN